MGTSPLEIAGSPDQNFVEVRPTSGHRARLAVTIAALGVIAIALITLLDTGAIGDNLGFEFFGQTRFLTFEAIYGCFIGASSGLLYALNESSKLRPIARSIWVFGGFLAYTEVVLLAASWFTVPFFSVVGLLPLVVVGTVFWLFGSYIDGFVSSMAVMILPGVCLGTLGAALVLGAFSTAAPESIASIVTRIIIFLVALLLVWGIVAFARFWHFRHDHDWELWAGVLSGVLVTAVALYHISYPLIPPQHDRVNGAIGVAMGSAFALIYPFYFIASRTDLRGRWSDG
jgi:hypothetical protein